MTVLRSVSWDDEKKKRRRAALALTTVFLVLPVAPVGRAAGPSRPSLVTVIVESAPEAAVGLRTAIADAGGAVTRELGLIDGVVARVPADAVAGLRAQPGVLSITLDGRVRLHSTPDSRAPDDGAAYDATTDRGSMWRLDRTIGARALWADGITGRGVDVALIDSGVVPVTGLVSSDKIVNGP